MPEWKFQHMRPENKNMRAFCHSQGKISPSMFFFFFLLCIQNHDKRFEVKQKWQRKKFFFVFCFDKNHKKKYFSCGEASEEHKEEIHDDVASSVLLFFLFYSLMQQPSINFRKTLPDGIAIFLESLRCVFLRVKKLFAAVCTAYRPERKWQFKSEIELFYHLLEGL